jgi:hypothetical protein
MPNKDYIFKKFYKHLVFYLILFPIQVITEL